MAKLKWAEADEAHKIQLLKLKDCIGLDAGYLVIPQQEIPDVFSPLLKAKIDCAVVMTSTGPSGTFFLVCNGLRIHQGDYHIDHEPFGIGRLSTGAMSSGLFWHHAHYDGRTSADVPAGFWDDVKASGVGNLFPSTQLPAHSKGPLLDLTSTSHMNSYAAMLDKFKKAGQSPW